MELETRELRYFAAVAEAGSVGRAAEGLHLTQAPLSRAIQRLERRLGVVLFERHARGVTPTAAGRVLLEESRAVLDAAATAVQRTRRAAAPRRRLVVATKAAANPELLRGLLDAHAASVADPVDVHVELCGPSEQVAMLRDGRADAAVLHADYDATAGLRSVVLGHEPLVAVLPADHPLAGRTALTRAEARDDVGLPVARCRRHDDGDDDADGPVVHDLAQLAGTVALGTAMALLPVSATAVLWDAHATVRILDAEPVTTVLAWPARTTSPAVAELVRVAHDLTAAPVAA